MVWPVVALLTTLLERWTGPLPLRLLRLAHDSRRLATLSTTAGIRRATVTCRPARDHATLMSRSNDGNTTYALATTLPARVQDWNSLGTTITISSSCLLRRFRPCGGTPRCRRRLLLRNRGPRRFVPVPSLNRSSISPRERTLLRGPRMNRVRWSRHLPSPPYLLGGCAREGKQTLPVNPLQLTNGNVSGSGRAGCSRPTSAACDGAVEPEPDLATAADSCYFDDTSVPLPPCERRRRLRLRFDLPRRAHRLDRRALRADAEQWRKRRGRWSETGEPGAGRNACSARRGESAGPKTPGCTEPR